MSRKAPNLLDTCWNLEFLNHLDLGFVDFNTSGCHNMAQDNTCLDHEVTFLPIQNQMDFFASLQNLAQVSQTRIKACTVHRKVIHEDLNLFFNEIRKDGHHGSLKGCWCITQTKRHSTVRVRTVGASKSGHFLVLWVDWYLEETRVTIQVTKVGMIRKPF